ncbi:hypothetical protein GPJ56_007648 [Histomonas meleagridis]|uniref:uncharacterized protein n=1 Tax=Histomonas meleagridis TaxID=135588 RepID=UPI003559B3C4|nr:hypothetical protein GPJ56_007648 [Histomonas meleagridis]KAH0802195.1 hypothetical protein GO595_005054 [Histomonas meleagridis]
MSKAIFVRNLPPNATIQQIKEAFSPFGEISLIYLCTDFYKDILYNFNSCFIHFVEQLPVEFFAENEVDVMIDDYFLEILSIKDSATDTTAVILGIPEGLNESELLCLLHLEPISNDSSDSEVTFFKPGRNNALGYALVRINDPNEYKTFISINTEVIWNNHKIAIHPHPTSNQFSCVVSLSPHLQSYAKLRNIEKFQDFTIHTPKQDFKVSSIIFASSSKLVYEFFRHNPPIHEYNIKTEYPDSFDFNVIIDAIYGLPIALNETNARFVHDIASELKMEDLMIYTGSIAYEQLTLQSAFELCNELHEKNINYDYVIDFIASHFSEILNEKLLDNFKMLNPEVIKKIAKSPPVQRMEEKEYMELFGDAVENNMLNISDIASMENKDININENREMLLENLDHPKTIYS